MWTFEDCVCVCVCVQGNTSTSSSVDADAKDTVIFPEELYRQTFNTSVSPVFFQREATLKSVFLTHTHDDLTSTFTLRPRTSWPSQLRSWMRRLLCLRRTTAVHHGRRTMWTTLSMFWPNRRTIFTPAWVSASFSWFYSFKLKTKTDWKTCMNQADFCSALMTVKWWNTQKPQVSGDKRWMFDNNKCFPLLCLDRELRPPAQQNAAQVFQQNIQADPEEDGRPACLIHSASVSQQQVSEGWILLCRTTVQEPGSWSGRKSKLFWRKHMCWFLPCSPPIEASPCRVFIYAFI